MGGLGQPENHGLAANVRECFDRSARESLAPVALVTGLVYAALVPAHLLVLSGDARPTLASLAAVSAVTCFALRWRWQRRTPPAHLAHALLALLVGILWLNSAVHLGLVREPRHATNFALLVLGSGFLFLSHRWFAAVLGATAVAWIALAATGPPSPGWGHFSFLLTGAGAIALTIHRVRVTTQRRLEIASLVTDRQRAEAEEGLRQLAAELQERNAELVRTNRELDEFAHVASHDLREPLRKLLSFSELLREDLGPDLPEAAAQDLGFINAGALRMHQLVEDLLELSRAGTAAMKREPISLELVADRALDSLSLRERETGARITRDRLPEVTADPTLLLLIYQNLIGNALKFFESEPPRIHLSAERLAEGWVLGVRDDGIGIPEDCLEEVFKPFRRLHAQDSYDGTGIGLAICRKAIERHGGRIWVESEPGRGSHFRFVLGD